MKVFTSKRAIMPLFLAASLLCAISIVSALTLRAQGRHGGDSRSSGGGESRSGRSNSGGSSSGSSSVGQSRSRSDGDRGYRGNSSRSSGDGSRSERRERERTSDSSSQSSSSGASGSGDDSRWSRHRDRDRHRHRDRDRDRDRRREREEQARTYRNTSVYQSSSNGGYRYGDDAYDRGYQDGLFTGANDGRRGQSYDPERSHFYRRGAPGFFTSLAYNSTARDSYREGFLRGYEEGYRNYSTYFTGGKFHR